MSARDFNAEQKLADAQKKHPDVDAFFQVLEALKPLPREDAQRVVSSVAVFLGMVTHK